MTTRRKMHVWALVVYFQYIFLAYATGNSQQFAWQGESANITCSLKVIRVHWYKEKLDGGLIGIKTNRCAVYQPSLKYCNENNILTIKELDENDTGIYYCSDGGLSQTFEYGSILLIRDRNKVEPILSILEQNQEDYLESDTIALMCVALHWSEEWSFVHWNISGNISEGPTMFYPDGVIRSLIFILKENTNMDLNAQCTVEEKLTGKTITATMRKAEPTDIMRRKRHDCLIVVYVGIGINVTVLLIHQIILFYRRRTLTEKNAPSAGGTVQSLSENEMVVYAAVT
ncbi:uncharacterized protein LOC121396921 [Xenopus laevis]|uniref:Uncharacterized protein LOC121396921 n=1 Tax=Xenopus laevis TaxID=8355 RepID=A0A8J1LG63_XENLA|nr:uncharacterized protein LOC121396921 [Xenopus laevis]